MASPHSPSKVIIKGTLAICCAQFVSCTCLSSVPPENRSPPTAYSFTACAIFSLFFCVVTGATVWINSCPIFCFRVIPASCSSTHLLQATVSFIWLNMPVVCADKAIPIHKSHILHINRLFIYFSFSSFNTTLPTKAAFLPICCKGIRSPSRFS